MPLDLTDRNTVFASLPKGGVGAEIGVGHGTFSQNIIRLAEPRLLYLVDCWEHLPVEVIGNDPANSDQESKDNQYHQVLVWFMVDPRVRVVKGFAEAVLPMFPDDYFDWLYLDANHLLCRQDIMASWPKVKPGGWLMGHDYFMLGDFMTVKRDVDQFVQQHGLTLQVTIDAGNNYKSWMIRKP